MGGGSQRHGQVQGRGLGGVDNDMVSGGLLPAISGDREMGGCGAYLSSLLLVIVQSLVSYFDRLGFVGGGRRGQEQ